MLSRLRVLFGTLILALIAAPSALAVETGVNGHSTDGGATQGGISGGGIGGAGTSDALPFTGMNLALILAAGAALVLAGLFLRRRGGTASS